MSSHSLADCLPPGTGLLLVGHGTRFAPGVDEFLALARVIAARAGELAVEPCFLELARPSIAEGFARLVERGARRVLVAPAILFAAGHVRRDIPREVAAAAALHPGVPFILAPHLGCHPALAQLSSQRFAECVAAAPPVARDETVLVLVGRGSRDPEATDEMLRFAQMRRQIDAPLVIDAAFLAMADPPLAPTLERLAVGAPRRIVVQPHLLFAGELLERTGALVRRVAAAHPAVDWRTTEHLGPVDRVADAVLSRAGEVAFDG